MKAQCESCKEIVALDFEPADGGIQVTCPSCAASYFVPARAAAAAVAEAQAAAPPSPPATRRATGPACPKCSEPREAGAPACRRCGLVYAKWSGQFAAVDASTPNIDDAREAAALWDAVEEGWDDPTRHDNFLSFCQKSMAYAFAASRYRTVQITRPDDVVAAARLKQLRALAEFTLARPSREMAAVGAIPSSYRWTKWVFVAILVIMAAGGIYIYFVRSVSPRRLVRPDGPSPSLNIERTPK